MKHSIIILSSNCLTLLNTLARALGIPNEVDPNVTNKAALRQEAREANPNTAPLIDCGITYNKILHLRLGSQYSSLNVTSICHL